MYITKRLKDSNQMQKIDGSNLDSLANKINEVRATQCNGKHYKSNYNKTEMET